MKKLIASLFVIAALVPGLVAAAERDSHAGHGGVHAAPAQSSLVDGVVKKIDQAGGKLTVSHGPLPNGMPAMTMAFSVKEASWLGKLKDGQKIRFVAEEIKGTMTITSLELPK